MGRLLLSELVWTDLEPKMKDIKVAIVPVGSCEQHGPNTTFVTDTDRAYEFCKLLGDEVGEKILIYPPVQYGISTHHMKFPGTITLRIPTMVNALVDIALSIKKHGFNKILFINGHGGNRVALETTMQVLKFEHDMEAYWSGMGAKVSKELVKAKYDISDIAGHACEIETSQCMHLCPWVVSDNLQKGTIIEGTTYLKLREILKDGNTSWDWKEDISENGALGDATRSNCNIGKLLTDGALDYVVNIIEEIIHRK